MLVCFDFLMQINLWEIWIDSIIIFISKVTYGLIKISYEQSVEWKWFFVWTKCGMKLIFCMQINIKYLHGSNYVLLVAWRNEYICLVLPEWQSAVAVSERS